MKMTLFRFKRGWCFRSTSPARPIRAVSVPGLLIACGFLLATSGLAVESDSRPPNIILIFTDDQGYNDIGCFGSPRIRTPNLDRMAAEGMRFTDFYSANSVCSPSRAALLTGCYPTRVGIPGVLFPRHDIGLNPEEITIAEMLREKGYATACIGKWHLGHHAKFLPTQHGFDLYFGIPYSNDMTIDPGAALAPDIRLRDGVTVPDIRNGKPKKNWVPLMRGNEVIEYPCDQDTLTERYTETAIRFIQAHQHEPFFLYLPHTMPHIPLAATSRFKDQSPGGFYGDVIEEIDWSIGEILETVDGLGLSARTLIIYTSDNGPWNLKNGHGGSAHPLRGFKFQTYEGGMRVPAIMRWPGVIPAGSTCGEVAATIDLLPTFARLANAAIPGDRVIDGRDILPLMRGDDGAATPHDHYFFYRGKQLESVRHGKWKLRHTKKNIELYDLSTDIGESRNLAEEHPDLVDSLIKTMQAFDEKLQAHARPVGTL